MNAVLEYNDRGCMLFSADCPGAFARGRDRREAMAKLPGDVRSFCRWAGLPIPAPSLVKILEEVYQPELQVEDADGSVLFSSERAPLTPEEYAPLRALVLKSAQCLDQLYAAIPDPEAPLGPERVTFYGRCPNTARAMFDHVNNCTGYYIAGWARNVTFCPAAVPPGWGPWRRRRPCPAFWTCPRIRRRTGSCGPPGSCCGAFCGTTESTPGLCSAGGGQTGESRSPTPSALPRKPAEPKTKQFPPRKRVAIPR